MEIQCKGIMGKTEEVFQLTPVGLMVGVRTVGKNPESYWDLETAAAWGAMDTQELAFKAAEFKVPLYDRKGRVYFHDRDWKFFLSLLRDVQAAYGMWIRKQRAKLGKPTPRWGPTDSKKRKK